MTASRAALFAVLACLPAPAAAQTAPAMADTVDTVPAGWTGPKFALSKDYPAAVPTGDPKPWKAFDFKTQPEQYIRAVLAYAREGNEAVDWAGQNNAVRKWYHAPGLVKGANGREFIHGLTQERVSPAKELHPGQTQRWTNWAVGLYNPAAAYTIGRVWKVPTAPDTAGVKFEDGAVGVKLLFTTAPVSQVPFLEGSKVWQANANLTASPARSPREVRLLQVDVAVRDDRADSTTGWVFGTFMYENDAPGATPLDKLVPVGVMWGNDPDLDPAKFAAGDRPKEGWLNPASKSPHVGWLKRLNGPVDNPNSSCLSCHARAADPQNAPLVFPNSATEPEKMAFFTNVKAGEPYKPGVRSLDYSLQLGIGVHNFPGKKDEPAPAGPTPQHFNFRAGEEQPTDDVRKPAPPVASREEPPAPIEPTDYTPTLLIVGGCVLAVVLIGALVIWLKRSPPAGAKG